MIAAACAALMLISISAIARGQSASSEHISAGTAMRALRDMGYSADLDKDEEGDPRVSTSVDGHKWMVYFYDCSDDKLELRQCNSFQFFADNSMPKPVSPQVINKWNKEFRYARAYIQQGNQPGCPDSRRGCAARIEIDALVAGTGADGDQAFRAYFGVMKRRADGFRK
jgi:hypothetical protein